MTITADKSKIVRRGPKGFPLTHDELDGNFTELSHIIDDVTSYETANDSRVLTLEQLNAQQNDAASQTLSTHTDQISSLTSGKQNKLPAVYNDNIPVNGDKVWGLSADGSTYMWKTAQLTPELPDKTGNAKKYLSVKADGSGIEYTIVGQKVGDVLVTANTPDSTYLPERKVYLKASYPELFAKLGTLGDNTPIIDTSKSPGTSLAGYAYGNGLHVMVSAGGQYSAYTSTDGITWTNRASALAVDISTGGLAFGAGLFVAVPASATTVYTSTDGITWTNRSWTLGTVASGQIAYGNGTFVVSNYTTGSWGTSVDGITWVARSNPFPANMAGTSQLKYLNGMFVAVRGVAPYLATSLDGVTWSQPTLPTGTVGLSEVTYGNGRWVALGTYNPSIGNWGVTSTDGITWTPLQHPATYGSATFLTFNTGVFVAMFTVNRGTGAKEFATSLDGNEWTIIPSFFDATSGNYSVYVVYTIANKAIWLCSSSVSLTHSFASYDTTTQFYVPGSKREQGLKGYMKAKEIIV